jgi:hypothetical protein
MPKAERQEETFDDEQTAVRPVSCRKCRDTGLWQDDERRYHYCDCKAGVDAKAEDDEGGD